MRETASKLPVKREAAGALLARDPFNAFREDIDRFFSDYDNWSWRRLFGRSPFSQTPIAAELSFYAPAIDIAEKKDAFEITAEVPGMEEKDIEVKLSNGGIFIKGEKKSDREEKDKNYYLSERSYGSFDRYFTLPAGVDAERISASFKNGILTVTLPKTPEAQKHEKTVPVKKAD